jgi:hypothetical protein
MKKLILTLIATTLLLTSNALAIPSDVDWAVDFRSSDWSRLGSTPYVHSFTVGMVTATALPDNNLLYWDRIDGLGVRGGEDDEIDLVEELRVDFAGGKYLTGVWITDLFKADDGGADGEWGQVDLTLFDNSTVSFDFTGEFPLGIENGELFKSFGDNLNVLSAVFSIPQGQSNGDEFSVAGFAAAPVPEPATLLLFGTGLIGLAGLGRKRLIKK